MEIKKVLAAPDRKAHRTRNLGILFSAMVLATLVLTSCDTIKDGQTVWITGGGANGTNPYSTSSAAPSNWKCHIPEGEFQVEEVDPQFDIVRINNCWISAGNSKLKTTRPKSTPAPLATPNVFMSTGK